ncbi:MAPEG family protein [Pseudahrensia aquimaris]|uniref:MAPEG family protein n=1 Tax=Pseudahrensia aquimaris TaxID=744461 RepID=A0ABW3FB09_9HYPH
MPLPITTLYTAITIFMVVGLALRVIGYRRLQRIALGDGGREELQKRISAHSNLTENAPFFIIALGLLEWHGLGSIWLHGAGLTWLIARFLHPLGVERRYPKIPLRVISMGLTLTLHMSSSLLLLWFAWQSM